MVRFCILFINVYSALLNKINFKIVRVFWSFSFCKFNIDSGLITRFKASGLNGNVVYKFWFTE